jgi:putative ABC transport system permease protein
MPRVTNIRLSEDMTVAEAMTKVRGVFKKLSPGNVYEFRFADEEYNAKFESENRVSQIARLFTVLAIVIACLGLFGLSTFMAEQRKKEIGIRKVLGASVTSLWQMLSTDFVILVVISCAIAIPIAYYFLEQWLQQYEYRTRISWWIFAFTGSGAVVIALLTVSFQSIKAAMANPVNSLKSE